MSAGTWGSVIVTGLMMYLLFLIFLVLLALIPPLQQRFGLRYILAWLVSSLLLGYFAFNHGGKFALLVIGSFVSAALVGFRYWKILRMQKAEPASTNGQT